jgi:YVTN family beta-propeller protein
MVPQRGWLLVADYGLDRLSVIDVATGTVVRHVPSRRQPVEVAVTADGSLAVVSNLIPATPATDSRHAAWVTVVDLDRPARPTEIRLPAGSTNVRGVVIDPVRSTAWVAHTLGRFHLPTTQLDRGWVITNALSCIDLVGRKHRATVLLDQAADGAADPWGLAIDAEGQFLGVTLSGVHQLGLLDLKRLNARISGGDPELLVNDLSALYQDRILRRIDLPVRGPRGIDFDPATGRWRIAGYFSGEVVEVDSGGGRGRSLWRGEALRTDPGMVRRGEEWFHDAGECFQRWLSCASCHPEARSDGLNWDLLNDGMGNPKNARSMLWSDRTPPVMSLGVRDRMETAVEAGFRHIQFSEPERRKVEPVVAYLKSLEPATSPYRRRDGTLTAAAKRGEKIFQRPSVGCARCHPAPLFTHLQLADVGTAGPSDRGMVAFDVPTLRELWRTPPYLHDGRAATLREVLVDHNPFDDHGSTSSLEPQELDDLLAYLLSL